MNSSLFVSTVLHLNTIVFMTRIHIFRHLKGVKFHYVLCTAR